MFCSIFVDRIGTPVSLQEAEDALLCSLLPGKVGITHLRCADATWSSFGSDAGVELSLCLHSAVVEPDSYVT